MLVLLALYAVGKTKNKTQETGSTGSDSVSSEITAEEKNENGETIIRDSEEDQGIDSGTADAGTESQPASSGTGITDTVTESGTEQKTEAGNETEPTPEPKEEETPVTDNGGEGSDSSSSDGIRPEIKAALDSYESFFDEYVSFMQEYKNSPQPTPEMLSQYSQMLTKYTETMAALETLGNSDLNNAELLHYSEVNLRISQKLAAVA